MKHILNIIGMLLAVWGLSAQQNNMVGYEYWIDSNYNSKTSQSITPAQTFEWQTNIPCEALSPGIHSFNARFKDQDGKWSPTIDAYFYKIENQSSNTIAGYEYWIDDQYTAKVLKTSAETKLININEQVATDGLSDGIHTFSLRVKDKNGRWSQTVSSYFFKLTPPVITDNGMVAYEYWIDNQYTAKVSKTSTETKLLNIDEQVATDGLSDGIHTFSLRAKDKNGRWSQTVSSYFFKITPPTIDNSLVSYEYWINDAYDQKVSAKIPNQQTFVLLDSINCSSANKVINTISYRFKDKTGKWSSTMTANFYRPVTISVNLTYTKSVLAGETPVVENWYPNYSDVGYTLFNMTKGKEIDDITFQYPDIVLNQQIDVGDSILITAISHSTTNSFKPVAEKIRVGNDAHIPVTFNIVQQGLIRSTYQNSENDANVGIVYDSDGNRIAQYDYSNKTLSTNELADGTYQLLSMANSPFFNTIQHLSDFASTELKQNTHYILQSVEVKSGKITEITVPNIPKLDESLLYYTTNNTSFSVNKTLTAIGNYVTLRSEIGFKEEYRNKVSNVKLIVAIPPKCSFVANSVMTGDAVFNGYSVSGNQLIIPLANYSDIVKFCIIPTEGGNFAPNGFVEFTLDGKTIRQPIGTANFAAEGLNIIVPDITAQKTIPVRGTVTAKSIVKVYDGDEFIGQTTALANGTWTVKCELYKPYNLSTHNIHADIVTPQGLSMQTETKEVTYDVTAIEVSKVIMYNTAHPATSLDLMEYVTEFNFLNPQEKGGTYWYWPNYPDFTFTIEFTQNDSTLIHDVVLDVLTSNGSIVALPTQYDETKHLWVASGKFPNTSSLPVNVSVAYNNTDSAMVMFDANYVNEKIDQYKADSIAAQQQIDTLNNLSVQLTDKIEQIQSVGFADSLKLAYYDSIFNQINTYLNSVDETKQIDYDYLKSMSGSIDNYIQYVSQFDYSSIKSNTTDLTSPNINMEDLYIDTTFFYEIQNFDINKLFQQKQKEAGIEVTQDDANPNMTRINFNNNQNVSIMYTVSTCENLTEGSLLQQGYEKIAKTDGSFIFAKNDDKGYSSLVDFSSNIQETMQINGDPNTVPWDKIGNFSSDWISTVLDVQKEIYNGELNVINKYMDDVPSLVNKIISKNQMINESYDVWNTAMNGKGDISELQSAYKNFVNQNEEYKNLLLKLDRAEKSATELKNDMKAIESKCSLITKVGAILDIYGGAMTILDQYDKKVDLDIRIASLDGVSDRCEGMIALKSNIYSNMADLNLKSLEYNSISVVGNVVGGSIVVAASTTIIGGIIGGGILAGLNYGAQKWFDNYYDKKLKAIDDEIKHLNCYQCPGEPPTSCFTDFTKAKNATFTLDPSGFVYEAVPSNYLSGVTTTVFQKIQEENMYGEKEDKVVQWNASEYAQENPLITNEYGIYGWDVPEGLWQVKYEKDGYQTVYSDWLPVPPPQLDLNVGMVQISEPSVKEVRGYEREIEIQFNKFMIPATLTTDLISVTKNGDAVSGTIAFIDEEANPLKIDESFVSKIQFVPAVPFTVDDEVTLTVKKNVQSYTETNMKADYVQLIPIQRKMENIVADSVVSVTLNQSIPLTISVMPADVAASKKIVAHSVSSSIATVTSEAVLNDKGQAVLQITGELPGKTFVYISVDGTDLKMQVEVNVKIPVAVSSVTLNKDSTTLEVGKMDTLKATILPADASNQNIVWTSSDPDVATVVNGIVTTIDQGDAIITASSSDGDKLATCKVIVSESVDIKIITKIDSNIILYPNPTKDFVTIKGAAGKTISIFDYLGKMILKQKMVSDVENISLNSLARGIYLVKITKNGKEIGTTKLIKN